MEANNFKTIFEAAVTSAKKAKKSGTQVAARFFLSNGGEIIVKQNGGSWFKYEYDIEKGILQIGDRFVRPIGLQDEPTAQNELNTETNEDVLTNAQQKNVNYIDIENIIGFSVEYVTD